MLSVLPKQIQGMAGGRGLGRAYSCVKAFGYSLIHTSKEIMYKRLAGLTCLMHAGKNTDAENKIQPSYRCTTPCSHTLLTTGYICMCRIYNYSSIGI